MRLTKKGHSENSFEPGKEKKNKRSGEKKINRENSHRRRSGFVRKSNPPPGSRETKRLWRYLWVSLGVLPECALKILFSSSENRGTFSTNRFRPTLPRRRSHGSYGRPVRPPDNEPRIPVSLLKYQRL